MNIHEYQAKQVLKGYGVPVAKGLPAFTVDEAVKAAETLGGPVWVVKAQIHAGGRGKAGGVKVVKSHRGCARRSASGCWARRWSRTRPASGKLVQRLYIEEGSADREASSICRCSSTARHRGSPSSSPPKAAWISRKSRMTRRKRSSPSRSIPPPISARIMCAPSPRR